MNTNRNRNRIQLVLLLFASSLVATPAQAGTGLDGFLGSLPTVGLRGLLFPNTAQAQAVSYQDLTYAVRELENRSRRFVEQFDRQTNYPSYGRGQRDVRQTLRLRLQRLQQTTKKLLRKTQYHWQTYRLRQLLERIQLLADDIELDLPWIRGSQRLRRPWQRIRVSMRRVENLFDRVGDGGVRQVPDVVPEPLPWQRPRSYPKSSPSPKPKPRPVPRSTHFPTWGEIRADNDIIEDYSERARNAFLAQLSTDYQLRRETWARKTRDQLIGFDQSANQLQKIVYSRPQNPGAAVAATVRQMLAQRQLIDQLIKGQNVNGDTRRYWSGIGQKLDHLSCLLVLDGCPQ